MTEDARQRDRLIGLFVLGVIALNPPLLTLFDGTTLFGWPLLYIYIFAMWAGLIGGVALVVERRSRHRATGQPDD